jgi:hypothetical protein
MAAAMAAAGEVLSAESKTDVKVRRKYPTPSPSPKHSYALPTKLEGEEKGSKVEKKRRLSDVTRRTISQTAGIVGGAVEPSTGTKSSTSVW